jgi:hypothetical protein
LLLFQQFDFEVVLKPGKSNFGLDRLSRIETWEVGGSLDDQLSDVNLFKIEVVPNYLEDITIFLTTGAVPKEYLTT